ncbi:transcriptional regulator [Pedobacter yonginense]|uniref:Transcriptional regulator n=1 Tax=Pedobacter yonginense TaxID=651869 RepID=A0A317EJX3_9SPHI|nr:helix-turn-helix transcriptional regulator [Pedobacter yonginense]PWS26163.1 transcriptional regulator [Pedobacter yonginense]
MKSEFEKTYSRIGKNVKFLRNQLGWSQDELASYCSVNRAKISRIENARADYMLSTLLEVCNALKTNLEEIIKLQPTAEY